MDDGGAGSRLDTELSLLEAIYPGEAQYSAHRREVAFSRDGASLCLRLPEDYPGSGLPEVVSARNHHGVDMRDKVSEAIHHMHAHEEVLDAILAVFVECVESMVQEVGRAAVLADEVAHTPCTIVVWLHHLLNTNKRKLALSPSTPGVSGFAKPGHPGVLCYSGDRGAVTEHIDLLKRQNWQAFQVRCELDEAWHFAHGEGVVEVETMGRRCARGRRQERHIHGGHADKVSPRGTAEHTNAAFATAAAKPSIDDCSSEAIPADKPFGPVRRLPFLSIRLPALYRLSLTITSTSRECGGDVAGGWVEHAYASWRRLRSPTCNLILTKRPPQGSRRLPRHNDRHSHFFSLPSSCPSNAIQPSSLVF